MTGPFEEEEEGAGIASDVVKVQVEDPDTPGQGATGREGMSAIFNRWFVPLGSLVMKPLDHNGSSMSV